jgi:hypothetical protein
MAGTVCLTFDFDALSLWISRRQTSPASLSRGEFGAVAVPRILQLLTTYGIQSTWFIPGHTCTGYLGYPFSHPERNSHRGTLFTTCPVYG